MHRKSWHYYRDLTIVWASFFLLLFSAAYALRHPVVLDPGPAGLVYSNPLRKAFYHAHPPRRINWLEKTALQFREVTFKSRDGLTLFGRFVPGRNKGTILLVHDLGQANQDMLFYAEIFANAGFGIFMFDLRAHGSSDGDTSSNGLREAEDIAGAVDYLLHRIDVNGQRIGALGIGLGAQAVLRGAMQTENIRAMVLEGLEPSMLSDHGGRQQPPPPAGYAGQLALLQLLSMDVWRQGARCSGNHRQLALASPSSDRQRCKGYLLQPPFLPGRRRAQRAVGSATGRTRCRHPGRLACLSWSE